jgi:hypothetical protein
MAEGTHWEWRAFGGVSARFANAYLKLPLLFDWQEVDDHYLWIPGLSVNAKFRTGADGDLKFKRLMEKSGHLEKWLENPNEIFNAPLSDQAWSVLEKTLASTGLHLPEESKQLTTSEEIIRQLEELGCKTVLIHKSREARIWENSLGTVKVEWASIAGPQNLVSISLENWEWRSGDDPDDAALQALINSTIQGLQLDDEPVQVMNYLNAVESWANGEKL